MSRNKKAILLAILAMIIFNLMFLLAGVFGGLNSGVDIPGLVVSLILTDVVGVPLLYGAMTWD